MKCCLKLSKEAMRGSMLPNVDPSPCPRPLPLSSRLYENVGQPVNFFCKVIHVQFQGEDPVTHPVDLGGN